MQGNVPISTEALLQGRVVEDERLEFKKGWNPKAVLHTLCAIARNQSPAASFETDGEHNYFITRFPVHPQAIRPADSLEGAQKTH